MYKDLKLSFLYRFRRIPFVLSCIAIILLVYDIGFDHTVATTNYFHRFYYLIIHVAFISLPGRYFFKQSRPKWHLLPLDLFILVFIILVLQHWYGSQWFVTGNLLQSVHSLYAGVLFFVVREIMAVRMDIKRMLIHPSQLFIISFLILVLIGTGLLLLPNATYTPLSFTNAMFTATSAVCVTGLVVVDTGTEFTVLGQTIILMLIQVGGIGIMTFASYFSYFFSGKASYMSQLALREMTNIDRIGEVFNILKLILLVTFLIEGIGAVLIFQTLDPKLFVSLNDKWFFAIFHSVSGFCNAGFSTLNESFSSPLYAFNYSLHLILALLIVFGGIGFPILLNLLNYIKIKFLILLHKVFGIRRPQQIYRIINVNTRIVVITTMVLIVVGTGLFFVFEYSNALAAHSLHGKIITAFFGSVTTRTAGFNTVDTASLLLPTVFMVLLWMWIGASPGSTGGGIKTSTLAVAFLNIISIARGKSRLEVFQREISYHTVNRAFAIIVLSLLVIGCSVALIISFDPQHGLLSVLFESVSAYSTVGLSRGITTDLSTASKWVLIVTMFIGRVSMLSILIALFKKVPTELYRYPSESILIN